MDRILDMPIDITKPIDGVSPLHILIVMKGIDEEGYEVDAVMHTEGLSLSNALGMAHYAVLFVENEVRESIAEAS